MHSGFSYQNSIELFKLDNFLRRMEFIQKLCDVFEFTRMLLGLFVHFVVYKLGKSKIQRNENDIRGKCVVVTGGSGGIGKWCVKEFAQRGAIVVIGVRNMETGRNVVDEIQKETGNRNVVNVFSFEIYRIDKIPIPL